MIPKTGNITLNAVLQDCGVSKMYGNGRLTSNSIRDRTTGTTSGSVSIRALAGTCTSAHRDCNNSWGATNYNTGVANKAIYQNPGNLEVTTGVNYVNVGGSRQSNPDQWIECHNHGYAVGGGSYIIDGKIKGFGSANAKEAPGQISVVCASTGFLSGTVSVPYSFQYYGTFSDRPINSVFNVPASQPYITFVMYQLLYGPDHVPNTDGIATLGKKYSTQFSGLRIRKA